MLVPKLQSLLLATSAISTLALAPAAQAQQAPASDATQLADVVVTAQRRSENLQVVPVSVTAVSAEALSERKLNDLQQISLATPSLQVGQENTYAIRGVGTLAFQQTIDPAVGIALDEVNLGRNGLSENPFVDVAQVEVLNGPQGLLFGKNASGGLINITTVKPKLGVFEGFSEVQLDVRDTTPGNGKGFIGRQILNLPLGETSALRLNFIYEAEDPVTSGTGKGQRFEPDRKNWETRVKHLWEPNDQFSLYTIGNYAEDHGTAGLFDRTYRYLAPGSLNAAPLAADGLTAGPNALEYKADGPIYRDLSNYGIQTRATWRLSNDFELVNIAAYKGYKIGSSFDQDFTTSNAASLSAAEDSYHQFSNELRLVLPAENRLSGQLGLYYMKFREREDNQTGGMLYLPPFLLPAFPFCVGATPSANPGPGQCGVNNDFAIGGDSKFTFDGTTYAAFGQLTYQLTPTVRLLGGGRLTKDKVNIDLVQHQKNYFIAFSGPRGRYQQGTDNTNFSFKLGAQYQPSSDFMFYATYATGYKGPGLNPNAPSTTFDLTVKPETSKNIELGAKTSWFDRRLTANIALFRTDYQDYQSVSFDPAISQFVIQNAASLLSKGAELSTAARLTRELSLDASVTLLDATFGDFPGASCYTGQTGCSAGGTFNAKGVRLPVAPKFTASLGLSYSRNLSNGARVFAAPNWYHRSAINYSSNGNPLTKVSASDVLGFSAGFEMPNGLSISVYCKNCTDRRLPNFIYADPGDASIGLLSLVQTFGFNSVRTIGVTGAWRY